MVKYDTVLIRYGELTTKGKNRKDFITRLYKNIKYALRDYDDLEYTKTYDRIYVKLTDQDPEEITKKLQRVFGISSFSFTEKVPNDIETLKGRCLQIAKDTEKKTFKIMAKRHDKSYPMHSDDVNRAIAGEILHNTDLKVDVHNPELLIRVEIHAKEEDTKKAAPVEETVIYRYQPKRPDFYIEKDAPNRWKVVSQKVDYLSDQYDLSIEEQALEFGEALAKMGVDDALREAGAKNGDQVIVNNHILDFKD
jgi:Obg family GTPase CgtA, C-terminal extension